MKLKNRLPFVLTLLGSLFFLFACNDAHHDIAERLNTIAYNNHYRNLDSVRIYADSVVRGTYSDDDKAEAYNSLAFYHIARMEYSVADSLLHEVYECTDNQVELFVAAVQMMRLCQRQSDNKNFYEFRQRAMEHRDRIYEEHKDEQHSVLNVHQQRRLYYAESEFEIVQSAYFYYVGLTQQSNDAIDNLNEELLHREDTAQYLAYLYNVGVGGYYTHGSSQEIAQQEWQKLLQCYALSIQYGYPYWQANALQALSEHLSPDNVSMYKRMSPEAVNYLNTDGVPLELLAGNLAERSLHIFQNYGDVYQQAAAWRTLANCYFAIGDYPGAVYSLQQAVGVGKQLELSPSLMSSIDEDMSMTFAALNDKQRSDEYRNKYLDLHERTRQDRQLEARAEQLASSVSIMNALMVSIIVILALLLIVLCVLMVKRYLDKRRGHHHFGSILQHYSIGHQQKLELLDEQIEETEELIQMLEMNLLRQQELYEEHRAKMSLIESLTPLIDRMLYEIDCLHNNSEDTSVREERMMYITELTDRINVSNDFLTEWIRLKQGELSLRIETFPLADVLNVVMQSAVSFRSKGVTLQTSIPLDTAVTVNADQSLMVKADKTLTLFMINTLCDNARKYTEKGGVVSINATDCDNDMVEISVTDTGHGMDEQQLSQLFVPKAINDQSETSKQQSHGFGLINCKGIIEKYKKTSPLFTHCMIGAESVIGRGTRIYFRLPKGIKTFMVMIFMVFYVVIGHAATSSETVNRETAPIYALADSIYQSNVDGEYNNTIMYARKCMTMLNHLYRSRRDNVAAADTLMLNDTISQIPTEVRWMTDSIDMPYDIMLTLRNEVAVASLALHDWSTYSYNNKVFTLLFREMSIDHNLSTYCQNMQRTENNINIAVVMLVVLLMMFVPIYYFLYYRHVIKDNKQGISAMQKELSERQQELDNLLAKHKLLSFEVDRLHVANNVISNSLSTIKHETMYFPSRISQIVRSADGNEDSLTEVAHYYRSLYGILSEQASYNCRNQLDVAVLRDMLLTQIAKLAAVRKSTLQAEVSDDSYIVYHVTIQRPDDMRQHLCTQIVRDLGELYGLRRCGIVVNDSSMVVTIPKY